MGRRLNLTTLDTTLLQPQHGDLHCKAVAVPPINQVWFRERLRQINMSQRQLAKKIQLDPAAVSLMFAGRRSITMKEAKQLADILLVPVTEVMRQAGIEVLDDVRKVPIAGFVGADCAVTLLPAGTHDMIMAPADVPTGSFAIQHRVVNSIYDGWISFVSGTQQLPEDALDRLSVVALKDGRLLRGIIRRGYKSGLYNLILVPDATVLENKEIAWAARILWVLPT